MLLYSINLIPNLGLNSQQVLHLPGQQVKDPATASSTENVCLNSLSDRSRLLSALSLSGLSGHVSGDSGTVGHDMAKTCMSVSSSTEEEQNNL